MTPTNNVRQFEHSRWEDALGQHPVWAANLSTGQKLRIASELLDQLEIINLALIGAVSDLQSQHHKSDSDTPAPRTESPATPPQRDEANPWHSTDEIRQTIELLSTEPPSALIPIVEIQEITLSTCKRLQGQLDQQPLDGIENPKVGGGSGATDMASSLHLIVSRSHPLPPTFATDLVRRLTTLYRALFDEALRVACVVQ